jgi:sugar phosphate isomerase/epimerase
MKLGAITTTLIEHPLEEAARRMHALGLECIEIGVGGYCPKNHCNPELLLNDEGKLSRFRDTLAENELTLSAFAVHGEPLHPDPGIAEPYREDFLNACRLAEKLDLRRLTLMAGLPEGYEGDRCPNWILSAFPTQNLAILEWQWEKRLIPYWKEQGKIACDHGLRLCFEMHPGDMVYKPENLLRLREAVGLVVCCNLDPSHLFPQGMDVIAVIRRLGQAIQHTHAKDSRLVPDVVRVNGMLDAKDFKDITRRSWTFRTVGYGHDELFWRDYISALRLVGYDDVLSIEHEDHLINTEEGFEMAVRFLKGIIPKTPPNMLWYERDFETDIGGLGC